MTERLTSTVEEAARMLGVSRGTAYAAARDGSLPTVRIGRRLLVPRCRLEQLLAGESLPVNNGAPPHGGETEAAGRAPIQ